MLDRLQILEDKYEELNQKMVAHQRAERHIRPGIKTTERAF